MSNQTDVVDAAIKHPIRRRLIGAIWLSSEPLSACRLHSEYVEGDRVSLRTVTYHARQLEKDGIVRVDPEVLAGDSIERLLVLDGPNSGEAIRRLRLARG